MASVLAGCSSADSGKENPDPESLEDTQHPGLRASRQTIIPFDGVHQAGIETQPQGHAILVAFDLRRGNQAEETRRNLTRLMRIWTDDARALTSGNVPLADLESELSSAPLNMTITVGWGPQLIADATLRDIQPWITSHVDGLPAFPGDRLDPQFTGGDILLQVCGDDVTAVSHALRVLTRGGRDLCTPRWTQRGFLDAPTGETPRNLLGFKDGTGQPEGEDWKNIWDSSGGTSMVVRRIVYDMGGWEALDRASRETVFGRYIVSGAPLGKKDEFDDVDLNATDASGLPFIDIRSHVGIAAGERRFMRRRAYNWDGDITPGGETGLIFISFQNDPSTGFTPLQQRLAENDRLNTWITHIGSAVFWCPPGTREGSYWGQSVLE